MYNLNTGEQVLIEGEPVAVSGPPCLHDPKVCPKGKPHGRELNELSNDLLDLYSYFKGIDCWPRDHWFLRWKELIRATVARAEDARMDRLRSESAGKGEDLPRMTVR